MNIFQPRDLIAISASYLLVEPSHYPKDDGYISDIEDNNTIDGKLRDQFPTLKEDTHSSNKKSTRTDL